MRKGVFIIVVVYFFAFEARSQAIWEIIPQAFYLDDIENDFGIATNSEIRTWQWEVVDGKLTGSKKETYYQKIGQNGKTVEYAFGGKDTVEVIFDKLGFWTDKISAGGERIIRRSLEYNKAGDVVQYEIFGESNLVCNITYDNQGRPIKKIEGTQTYYLWDYEPNGKIIAWSEYNNGQLVQRREYYYMSGQEISSFKTSYYLEGSIVNADSCVVSYDRQGRANMLTAHVDLMRDKQIFVYQRFFDEKGRFVGGVQQNMGVTRTYNDQGLLVSVELFETGNILVKKTTYEYTFP